MTTVTRTNPEIGVVASGIKLPERTTKRGTTSAYPFAALATVGAFFGVMNKTLKQVSGIVSNANRKGKVKKTDEAGNVVYNTKPFTGADGVTMQVPDTEKPVFETVAHYYVAEVTPDIAKQLKGTPNEKATLIVVRDI